MDVNEYVDKGTQSSWWLTRDDFFRWFTSTRTNTGKNGHPSNPHRTESESFPLLIYNASMRLALVLVFKSLALLARVLSKWSMFQEGFRCAHLGTRAIPTAGMGMMAMIHISINIHHRNALALLLLKKLTNTCVMGLVKLSSPNVIA